MSLLMFYQLSRSSAENTVINLLNRALEQGWRVMIRGTDTGRLLRLDEQLWLGASDSFMPHGLQGGAQDADQHVLLGAGAISNDADALMLLDSAEALFSEVQALRRVWVIFDGANEASLAQARTQWVRLTQAGIAAQYWSEESGTWAKKAEKG